MRERLERARTLMAPTGRDGDPAAFVEEQRESTVVGTVDEVRERLAQYEDAGVERVLLQQLDHGDLETVALIGQLV